MTIYIFTVQKVIGKDSSVDNHLDNGFNTNNRYHYKIIPKQNKTFFKVNWKFVSEINSVFDQNHPIVPNSFSQFYL